MLVYFISLSFSLLNAYWCVRPYYTGCSTGNDIIFWLLSQTRKHPQNTFGWQNFTESIAFWYQVSKNSKWIILIFYISVCLSPGIGDIFKNTKKIREISKNNLCYLPFQEFSCLSSENVFELQLWPKQKDNFQYKKWNCW